MVSVSASVNLSLHHKVQKFSSGTGSPGWTRKKSRKTVVVVVTILEDWATLVWQTFLWLLHMWLIMLWQPMFIGLKTA